MKDVFLILNALLILNFSVKSQTNFPYQLRIEAIQISGFPALHSFAFAQHNSKWLLIGGRKDGLHARQPFNAFPSAQNNTDLYVYDSQSGQLFSTSLNSLPAGIKEQLQSTNLNFFQQEDTLVLIGGYCFSATANDHITFPKLTTLIVSSVIDAVVQGNAVQPFIKQITSDSMAVTGGQLGMLNGFFYLVGGQRFDGRYNPMGNPTYNQAYSNQIRKFKLNNSGLTPQINQYSAQTDAVHLHRRDYNLVPDMFGNADLGYTVSSGVFQPNADLPWLYPIEIRENNFTAVTAFNQFLSNYHSAKVSLWNGTNGDVHHIFFGGMSRYYYQNGVLVEDNLVPFVKTVSRMWHDAVGNWSEVLTNSEMPVYTGAGAEFIPNHQLAHEENELIRLHDIQSDSVVLGYIVGGIVSSSLNPFSVNQTGLTSAGNTIYRVSLVKDSSISAITLPGKNDKEMRLYPNPAKDFVIISLQADAGSNAYYFLSDACGRIVKEGKLAANTDGNISTTLSIAELGESTNGQLTVVINGEWFYTKKIQRTY